MATSSLKIGEYMEAGGLTRGVCDAADNEPFTWIEKPQKKRSRLHGRAGRARCDCHGTGKNAESIIGLCLIFEIIQWRARNRGYLNAIREDPGVVEMCRSLGICVGVTD